MKCIDPSVKEIVQEPFLEGIFKQIATAGRVCYASERNDNFDTFVENLIKSQHLRPLEFGTVYLRIHFHETDNLPLKKLLNNHWTKYKYVEGIYYITTNYRVLVENNWLQFLDFLCEPSQHYRRRTFLWTISRGIADEFRTHCAISSLMQSTRYCDYSKDKFCNELTFIKPHWISSYEYASGNDVDKAFYSTLEEIEYSYLQFRHKGFKPEQAREVLPLSLKTEFIQCAFESDWQHFLDLRLRGTTGKPHPDALFIAEKMSKLL